MVLRISGKALRAEALCALFSCALLLVSAVPAAAGAAPASHNVRTEAAGGVSLAGRAHGLNVGHAHIYPALLRGAGASSAGTAAASGGNLTYHSGSVQHHPTFYAIFWLPSGTHYEPGIINGDSGYMSLMGRYLHDAGSTNLANVASQYYDITGGVLNNIAPSTQYGGAWTNTTPYPESPLLDVDSQSAVNRALAANPTWQDGTNSTFFVFTGYNINSCMTSAHSSCTPGIASSQGYCAYHSYFADARGHQAVYANMPEDEYWVTTGVFTGEGCASTHALPNGDIYADNEFSALSHEQREAETDPLPGLGWVDSTGTRMGTSVWANTAISLTSGRVTLTSTATSTSCSRSGATPTAPAAGQLQANLGTMRSTARMPPRPGRAPQY